MFLARKVSVFNIVKETCLKSAFSSFKPLARIGIYRPAADIREVFRNYGIKEIRADKIARKVLDDSGFSQKFIDNFKTYFSVELSVENISQRYVSDIIANRLAGNLADTYRGLRSEDLAADRIANPYLHRFSGDVKAF